MCLLDMTGTLQEIMAGICPEKDMIKDDTLIFQFFRPNHRLTNLLFYFYLGEQGPELQAGATLTSSAPPHPRKSVSRKDNHESKI